MKYVYNTVILCIFSYAIIIKGHSGFWFLFMAMLMY